jgi:hypothetical protein
VEPKPVICCIIIKIKLTNKIATIQSHSNENSSNICLDTKCQTFLCFLLKIFLLKQNLSLLVFSIHRQPAMQYIPIYIERELLQTFHHHPPTPNNTNLTETQKNHEQSLLQNDHIPCWVNGSNFCSFCCFNRRLQ